MNWKIDEAIERGAPSLFLEYSMACVLSPKNPELHVSSVGSASLPADVVEIPESLWAKLCKICSKSSLEAAKRWAVPLGILEYVSENPETYAKWGRHSHSTHNSKNSLSRLGTWAFIAQSEEAKESMAKKVAKNEDTEVALKMRTLVIEQFAAMDSFLRKTEGEREVPEGLITEILARSHHDHLIVVGWLEKALKMTGRQADKIDACRQAMAMCMSLGMQELLTPSPTDEEVRTTSAAAAAIEVGDSPIADSTGLDVSGDASADILASRSGDMVDPSSAAAGTVASVARPVAASVGPRCR